MTRPRETVAGLVERDVDALIQSAYRLATCTDPQDQPIRQHHHDTVRKLRKRIADNVQRLSKSTGNYV